MKLTDEIKRLAVKMGADLAGVAPVERFRYAPVDFQPQYFMKDARSVIVLAMRLLEGICDVHGAYNQEGKTIGPYAWYSYPIVNWSISTIAMQIGKQLEDKGYRALPFPPTGFGYRHEEFIYADFLHKHAAVAAGLGELGLNRLFISPQFGSHQRLVSIITNAPLDPDPMYNGPKLCNRKECRDSCLKICPMKAFTEKMVSVNIGDNIYEYRELDSVLCLWHTIAGKYLRGSPDLPRYPSRKEVDELTKAAGGRNKLREKIHHQDQAFGQFTYTPTCGACIVKCRAPWT
jgi:epoxyqueuosine reductase QueG